MKSDPFHDKAFAVTGVTSTTITVQVLSTKPSTNTTAHTFPEIDDILFGWNTANQILKYRNVIIYEGLVD